MSRPFPTEVETAFSPFANRNSVLQGVEAKKRVVVDLIEGRLTFLEAVARFDAIHRDSTANLEMKMGILASHDGESLCRKVIGWVPLVLGDRPEQADAITARLEGELQAILDRFGKVLLPSLN